MPHRTSGTWRRGSLGRVGIGVTGRAWDEGFLGGGGGGGGEGGGGWGEGGAGGGGGGGGEGGGGGGGGGGWGGGEGGGVGGGGGGGGVRGRGGGGRGGGGRVGGGGRGAGGSGIKHPGYFRPTSRSSLHEKMELIPRLNLVESPTSLNGPVYTVAQSCGSTRSTRSSASTISWGTESCLQSPRPATCRVKPTGNFDNWTAQVPPDSINNADQKYSCTSQQLRPTNSEDSFAYPATGNRTDQGYSQLADVLKPKSQIEIKGFKDKTETSTHRQMVPVSPQQQPDLAVQHMQNIRRSNFGVQPHTGRKLQIWFTAHLSVFEPNDPDSVTAAQRNETTEWLNSVSSWRLRNFTGIGFPHDATWSLYEDHCHGKRIVLTMLTRNTRLRASNYVRQTVKVKDFKDKTDTSTHRQMVPVSPQQQPDLADQHMQNIRRSNFGVQPHTGRKLQIWFTAHLSVFEPNDPDSVTAAHRSETTEWLNSVSSWRLRNFTGIGFPHDATWSLYEDHCHGKSTKALPFLRRSIHRCAWGPRVGEVYIPEVDIFPGSRLFITYPRPDYAPEPLRRFLRQTGGVLRIDVTAVDRNAQKDALETELSRQKVPQNLWFSVMAKLHIARLPLNPDLQLKLLRIQSSWRSFLRKQPKPIEVYTQLYAHCRSALVRQMSQIAVGDEYSLESSSRQVLEQCLRELQLPAVHCNDFELLWDAWKAIAGYTGVAHHSDYMRLAFGDLSIHQSRLVIQAFLRMDPNRLGHVKLLDLHQFYTPSREAIKEFGDHLVYSRNKLLNAFNQFIVTPERVDFSEFEAFHQGVSIGLSSCLADSASEQSNSELLVSIMKSNYSTLLHPLPNSDKFERFIRLCWGVQANCYD
ncbi:unnamed protein product [Dicrocoelium dendriticum]|nr:unnamed protein product [Dicrocoelium dendriticum]